MLRLEVPLEALASFDEAESRFVLEAGEYRFWLGAEELLRLVVGDPTKGQGSPESSGVYPPGAAAVTTGAGSAPEMVLADGPAGLRLAQDLDISDGRIVPRDLGETLLRFKTPVPDGAARR